MGDRQNTLLSVIDKNYTIVLHPRQNITELSNSKYQDTIVKVFALLGGVTLKPTTKYGGWDIPTKNFIIELDEERHFNRYRLLTLQSEFYLVNPYFSISDYINYCKRHEGDCLKAAQWGKNWKNDSTERQFIESDQPGEFNKGGSSRWKQRAFYDFLKDISSKVMGVPVIRISIYDSYKDQNVHSLLKKSQEKLLLELIDQKLTANSL